MGSQFGFASPYLALALAHRRASGLRPHGTQRPWHRSPTRACAHTLGVRELVTLPPRLAQLTHELHAYDGAYRYARLAELGTRMPSPPARARTREYRVPGCISVVHVLVDVKDDDYRTVHIEGTADSAFARGLLALLVLGVDGLTSKEFLSLRAEDIAEAAGIPSVAGSSRNAALSNILRFAQRQVQVGTGAVNGVVNSKSQNSDVAVLLSGGVDSAVALNLALQKGLTVRAFYLRIWLAEEEAHLGHCPWEEDVAAARAVCEQAGVELELVPLQEEYRKYVVDYVVREARSGRTPNPDVLCNSKVKFGAFYEYVGKRFETVVSGHYAHAVHQANGVRLFQSPDEVKDQTYFLSGLKQEQLERVMFPLGEMRKEEVRSLAQELQLPNWDRRDSQGVCFLGKLKWSEFLRVHLGSRAGAFVEWETGREVGAHEGFWFYTLGQRRGIGLADGPWHVVSKDVARNVVYVSRQYWGGAEEHGMQRRHFEIANTSWISGSWPIAVGEELACGVKVRHGPNIHQAILKRTCEQVGSVQLSQRDKALAPGQFAVFYRHSECLGCGVLSGFPTPQPGTGVTTSASAFQSPHACTSQ